MIITSPYEGLLSRIPVRRRETVALGSRTRFWDYGDSAARTTIVVVHGFRGDHHGLEPVIAQLGSVRVLAPDLPGFGESEPFPNRGHSVNDYSAWLMQFVKQVTDSELISGELVVLGHSFGSILVSAAMAEGLVASKLILVNPIAAPALNGPRGMLTRLAVFYYWLGARLPERLGHALLMNRLIVRVTSIAMAKTRDRGLKRWIHNQHDRYFSSFANRQVVLEAFRASIAHDVSEFAERINTPTLLIAAERDDITPVAAQKRLVKRFSNATLKVIPAVGHLIHYETPAAAAHEISAFLTSDSFDTSSQSATTDIPSGQSGSRRSKTATGKDAVE